MPDPLRVFLDANILFSAAYRTSNGFVEFWNTAGLVAMTSFYAAQEVRRNCRDQEHLQRLESLLAQTIIVSDAPNRALPPFIILPAKDQPILAAAINAGADFLITGDKGHFSQWMNRPIETRHGMLMVMEPRPFLDWLKFHPTVPSPP
jgi:predicted nucleic acid-binding protein